MNIYCTYFNSGYLDRAVVLLRSLAVVDPGFRIEVLCFDDQAYSFFMQHHFHGVVPHRLSDFEERNPDLLAVKTTRTIAEYFFTCTSVWTADVAKRNRAIDFVTYLDCDMRFFDSPGKVFDMMVDKDIMICPHYYSRNSEIAEKYGKYNVGWLTFRSNDVGMECLNTWRNNCIEWCYERLEPNRYADQKYLDDWPLKYGDRLLEAPLELDLGPWGIKPGAFSRVNGQPYIEGIPIIIYHFQGLRLYSERLFYMGHCFHQSIVGILKGLYEPYIQELLSVHKEFELPHSFGNARRKSGGILRQLATGYWLGHPHLSEVLRWVQRLAR
ncbi:MAG: hypothetical protein IKS36_02085 [Bacteroidales bacterium]|nr:hypothetical protein [Bacteroidales bacterium]